MLLLIVGLVIFVGIHLVPTNPNFRLKLVEGLGEGAYKGLFSLVSLLALIAIIYGYSRAQVDMMWYPPDFLRHIAHLLMLFALPILVSAYLPTGKIKAKLKNPMIISVKIWAFAHLLVNGDLASILLLGTLLFYAVFAMISARKRQRSNLLKVPKRHKDHFLWDIIAISGGFVLYGVLAVWAHETLFGVSVFS